MAEPPQPDKKANSQLKPIDLASPKRGAFPTPRSEIEKAKPYLPETDQAADQSAAESESPENADPNQDSEERTHSS
jgi:hypothetical protein